MYVSVYTCICIVLTDNHLNLDPESHGLWVAGRHWTMSCQVVNACVPMAHPVHTSPTSSIWHHLTIFLPILPSLLPSLLPPSHFLICSMGSLHEDGFQACAKRTWPGKDRRFTFTTSHKVMIYNRMTRSLMHKKRKQHKLTSRQQGSSFVGRKHKGLVWFCCRLWNPVQS